MTHSNDTVRRPAPGAPSTPLRAANFRHFARWAPLITTLWIGALGASHGAPLSEKTRPVAQAKPALPTDGVAEARLIEVYRQIGKANHRAALRKVEALVADYPHFQLAQMVYGDLLSTQTRPVQEVGDVPSKLAQAGVDKLKALRAESQLRLAANAWKIIYEGVAG